MSLIANLDFGRGKAEVVEAVEADLEEEAEEAAAAVEEAGAEEEE